MNKKECKKLCDESAEYVSMMTESLKAQGFTLDQSVQLVAAMISSSVMYVPMPHIAIPTDGKVH